MCICLNCFRISNCILYYKVGQKHDEVTRALTKLFFPQSPILQVLISYSFFNDILLEWDINDCLSYQEKPGSWIFHEKSEIYSLPSTYLYYDIFF